MTPMIQKVNKFKLVYRFVLFLLAVASNYRLIVSDSISTEYCIYFSCLIAIIEVALFIISRCVYRSVRFFLIRGLRYFRELSLVYR